MLLQPSGASADTGTTGTGQVPDVLVDANDPRYAELLERGFNARFSFSPDRIRLAYTADQIVNAVNDAVRRNQRFTVRSGGHCMENLVADPTSRMLIDVSAMKGVSYDPAMRAFAVGSGSTLGEMYQGLFLGWGVTAPGGICPPIGVGGHIAGGGYGALSRRYGLIVDHLYAVEVVVVDRSGRAKKVVATREPDDPNHDLWWAHTGGGGGNFGVVTKYWLRSPGVDSKDPSMLLPRPPTSLLTGWVTWDWNDVTEADFIRLAHNHGAWHAANSAPDSPWVVMHSALHLNTRRDGNLALEIRLDAGAPNAQQMVNEYIGAVTDGVKMPATPLIAEQLWLDNTLVQYPPTLGGRTKSPGSNMRKPLTDDQMSLIYDAISDPNTQHSCLVYLGAYGGKISTVSPTATAMPHRDTIYMFWLDTTWVDPSLDNEAVDWTRQLYRKVHADTGGVPVPNDQQDGSYINYPNVDFKDPAWNTSGVPWYTLYYKENYPRLQRVKAAYDPLNIFHHALSIQPA